MSDISYLPTHLDLPPSLSPLTTVASPEVVSAVFDALADAVVVYDREGRIVGRNPAAVALFGLTQPAGQAPFAISDSERALGGDLQILGGEKLPPPDWPLLRVLRGETLQGAKTMDVVVHALGGRELILNVSGAPLLDTEGQVRGAVCVYRDIMERMQLERKFMARAAEMEGIFATQTEAVVFADRTGRIIRMNEAQRRLCALAGVDPEAKYIQTWTQTAAQHDAEGQPIEDERRVFYRALRGETVTHEQAVEFYQRSSQGQELVLRISGAPVCDAGGEIVGAVLSTEDVTQQRRLERELTERAGQIEGIFETLTDGILLVDASGRIVRMNEAERQLVGYDATLDDAGCLYAEFAERRMPRDLENRPFSKELLPAERILRGETLTGANAPEIRVRALDGRELIIRISGAPLRNATGNISGAVVAISDVTERYKMEEQRSDILRAVAHDLLTPITGVRLYLQTQARRLRKGQPPFLPGEGHFDALDTNLLRMERLVNDLRDMASIESGALMLERHLCDLRVVCCKEIETEKLLKPGRIIQLVLPPEPLLIEADEQRIGQVVANFLSNALKYSPSDQPVTLRLSVDGAVVHIEVKDRGPGIPAAELDRVWERFHRVEGIQAHHGTKSLGLGLYICRAIVEGYGGRVGVKSTVGVGSTFWCTLPLATASDDSPTEEMSTS
ncbi:MAG: PAS domain S-box protein [Ktedonobacterales bacterium]